MPSKDEKQSRKALQQGIRKKQREQARAALPASALQLKALFDFIDQHLHETECDHTLRFATTFVRENNLDEAAVLQWLGIHGGYCDCEALSNVEQVVSEALPGYDALNEGPVQ